MTSIIEIYHDGCWIAAAEFNPVGEGPYTATFEYRPEYVFGRNPLPVSLTIPVTTDRLGFNADGGAPSCPAFLLDLVPQGRGRKHLSDELNIADKGAQSDLVLAQYGAFNPVGNLRLDTAVAYQKERSARMPVEQAGYTLDQIISRQDEFLEHIWYHAMLTAGTTGLQGAAPKFLLTQNKDGRWFADAALPDAETVKHWLIKLPRGSHESDYTVLRNEAAYLGVAERCGIRTHGAPQMHCDMLFVQRFDRVVDSAGLRRLHQESLASLSGSLDFGRNKTLFELVEAFRPYVSNPVAETIEFIQRDILNMAMRNTDNHARNTAVQRTPDGRVQLTPVFDFAPMYMDRQFITRGCKWQTDRHTTITEWEGIIQRLSFGDGDRLTIANGVKAFQPMVEDLPQIMLDCGVETRIIDDCKATIETQVDRLERLPVRSSNTPEAGHGQTP